MRYYNATRAAQEIGISYKTILRRIEEGKIIATKGEDNQFLVAESEVEKHKRQRIQFVHSRPAKTTPVTSIDQSELLSKIDGLERRVADLEKIVQDITSRDQKALIPPEPEKTGVVKSTTPKLQNRATIANSPIQEDWMLCSDFFESYGIKETTYRRWIANGLSGDRFELEEIPRPGRADQTLRYFTPDQQQKALNLLKKHGKLPET